MHMKYYCRMIVIILLFVRSGDVFMGATREDVTVLMHFVVGSVFCGFFEGAGDRCKRSSLDLDSGRMMMMMIKIIGEPSIYTQHPWSQSRSPVVITYKDYGRVRTRRNQNGLSLKRRTGILDRLYANHRYRSLFFVFFCSFRKPSKHFVSPPALFFLSFSLPLSTLLTSLNNEPDKRFEMIIFARDPDRLDRKHSPSKISFL